MHANRRAEPSSFFYCGCELRGCVLIGCSENTFDHEIFAGLIDLGEIGTFFVLLAHDFDELLGGVGIVGVGEHVLCRVVFVGVLVSTEEIDGVSAGRRGGADRE